MVRITEKRTSQIPPSKIDKDLLFEVGRILEEVCPEKHKCSIRINANSKDIETENCNELKDIDIPSDTNEIVMSVGQEDHPKPPWENPIQIDIDCKFPKKNSKIRVKGKDATWVKGTSQRIEEQFEKKKLLYSPLAIYEPLRLVLSILSSILLSYGIGLALWYFKIDQALSLMFIGVFFYAMALLIKRFFDWVFPYFEIVSEDFMPSKVRAWALAILWGSGILTAILFKMLGL